MSPLHPVGGEQFLSSVALRHTVCHSLQALALTELQVDGYAGYRSLTDPRRPGGPAKLVFCWAHCRPKFYEIAEAGHPPIAEEALKRIALASVLEPMANKGSFYAIEADLRGQPLETRCAGRQARIKPIVDDLRPWLEARLARLSGKSRLAEAIRYTLKLWKGPVLFLDDGHLEPDTNPVERAIRPDRP